MTKKGDWRPFEEAREYVRNLGLKDQKEWIEYCKSKQRPKDIPSDPRVYKDEFKGINDWLGTDKKEWRPFQEAREHVRSLGLKNQQEWQEYCTSEQRPDNIPTAPDKVYKDKWISWGDWLGTGVIANRKMNFLTFEEARECVRSLGLKSFSEWRVYAKSEQKPNDIPSNPSTVYKEEWTGWGDWLSTGNVHKKDFLTFEEARECVRSLGLKTQKEWYAYRKSEQKPNDIPSAPHETYKEEWISMGDWLGTETIAPQKMEFLSFENAREHVRSLGLKNQQEWHIYSKSGQRPSDIPSEPRLAYKEEWIGLGDWLGVCKKEFLSFEEARMYVRSLGLKSFSEWRVYAKSEQKPNDIPSAPHETYKEEWRGWGDWLGTVNKWTKAALLALLQDLRLHIGNLDESEIYMLLQQSGALPTLYLATRNRSAQSVLKDLKENEGRDLEVALKGIAEEELEVPHEEVEDSDYEEIHDEDQLDPEKILNDLSKLVTPEGLKAVDMMSPVYGLNEDIAEYLVSNRVNALWICYINGESEKVARALQGTGGRYFHEIKMRFLAETHAVESLPVPAGWSFKDDYGVECQPFLMQRWAAWQVREKQRIGNWSGVGAGKTLSAILASRVIDAHVTVIVANSATISEQETANGWERQILNAYPDSIVHRHEEIKKDLVLAPDRHHYILLNYEKFQIEGERRSSLIDILLGFNPDFIVLDEIHFVKQRGERASNRREALEYLISNASEINPSLHMLGMSATPVINNLQEAKKLLEIVTGDTFPDVGTVPTINNALTLHRLLMLHGLRYRPRYEKEMPPIKVAETHNELLDDLQKAQKSILTTEQTLLPMKLEIARSHFKKGTLVYTHYVDKIIEPTRRYLG